MSLLSPDRLLQCLGLRIDFLSSTQRNNIASLFRSIALFLLSTKQTPSESLPLPLQTPQALDIVQHVKSSFPGFSCNRILETIVYY